MPVRRPVETDIRFSPPGWGELIGEQYILVSVKPLCHGNDNELDPDASRQNQQQTWDPSSRETIQEQRTRLARQYSFELVVQPEWIYESQCRIREPSFRKPTDAEISTILRPWRIEDERLRALRILRTRASGDGEAMIVRTYYGDGDDEAWEEMVRERKENATCPELEEDEHSILDDPALFAAADGDGVDGWRRVYDVLPELAEKMWFGCGPAADTLAEAARANPEESLLEKALSGFRSTLKCWREIHGMREPPEDVIECVRRELQEESVVSYIVVADSSTFRNAPAMLRVMFLDARCDIIRHSRVDLVEMGLLCVSLAKRRIADMPGWLDGGVGDKYRPDGSVGARLYRRGMEVMEEHLRAVGLTILSVDSA